MSKSPRGRLHTQVGIGVSVLVPGACLALLATQVNSAGYVLPASVGTLAGSSPTVLLPTSTPTGPATVGDAPIEVLTAPRSAVADVHRADAAYARAATGAVGGDIPDVALAAYYRAATVINATDKSCHLSWELLAAIGRVESNHGRFAGSSLDADGVATPPILGPRLDGTHGTSRIRDTDAGDLDGDPAFDRAVGPMQFIPSTWTYVGVDSDGDGRRDPQDIQDAALGAAVYLCVGKGDLSTTTGQRAAVYRYNHSQHYVDLVLSIARGYAAGTPWQTPGTSAPATTISTVTTTGDDPTGPDDAGAGAADLADAVQIVVVDAIPAPPSLPDRDDPTPTPPDDPGDPTDPTDPTDPADPTDPTEPSDPAEPDPTDTPAPTEDPAPSEEPTEDPAPSEEPTDGPTPAGDQPTTQQLARALCEEAGILDGDALAGCIEEAVALLEAEPDTTVDDLVARLEDAGIVAP